MSMYNIKISIPECLDRILAGPVLTLRKIWYGYSFRRIRLVNSKMYAIVDVEDFYELCKFTWSLYKTDGGYHAIRLSEDRNNRHIYMHREIVFKKEYRSQNTEARIGRGEKSVKGVKGVKSVKGVKGVKSRYVVDHINNNGLDNRRANLRMVTMQQNNMNRRATKGASKYKGVHYRCDTNQWRAAICHNYKRIHIGSFDNEIDAARAYDAAALKYFGQYAYLNFGPKKKEKGLRNAILRLISNSKFQISASQANYSRPATD